MNQYYIFLIFLFFSFSSNAQNLVPNAGFEDYSTCPTLGGQIYLAENWNRPINTTGTPDYYHSCFIPNPPLPLMDIPHNWTGYQPTHTGEAYIGIYNFGYEDLREYVQAKLTSPLEAGATYQFEMYVNTSNYCGIAIDALGAYFSESAIYGDGNYKPLDVMPQTVNSAGNILTDTANWTLISDVFIAEGGENYITIGNFLTDSMTQHFIFDPGSYLQGYTFIDDVSVTLIDTVLSASNKIQEFENIIVFPNPAKDKFTIQLQNNNCSDCTLFLFSPNRKKVRQIDSIFSEEIDMEVADLPSGIYLFQLINGSGEYYLGKVLISN